MGALLGGDHGPGGVEAEKLKGAFPYFLMRVEDVENAIRKQAGSLSHYPDGSLVCVENTSKNDGRSYGPNPCSCDKLTTF